MRAKARAALFRDIGVIKLIQYLRDGVPPSNEFKKKSGWLFAVLIFFSYRAERGRQLKLLESGLGLLFVCQNPSTEVS